MTRAPDMISSVEFTVAAAKSLRKVIGLPVVRLFDIATKPGSLAIVMTFFTYSHGKAPWETSTFQYQ